MHITRTHVPAPYPSHTHLHFIHDDGKDTLRLDTAEVVDEVSVVAGVRKVVAAGEERVDVRGLEPAQPSQTVHQTRLRQRAHSDRERTATVSAQRQ
jgi:hypothetical protein